MDSGKVDDEDAQDEAVDRALVLVRLLNEPLDHVTLQSTLVVVM